MDGILFTVKPAGLDKAVFYAKLILVRDTSAHNDDR